MYELALLFLLTVSSDVGEKFFELPPLPPPQRYGNILINRQKDKSNHPAVGFSHWTHRTKYTCRVCHFELNFALKVNATDITEEKNQKGEFCGACHNGQTAFGHTEENCKKCHNDNIGYADEKFKELANLPKTPYGNQINWVKALRTGLIKPKKSLFDENYEPPPFTKALKLAPEWHVVTVKATFPHKKHTDWLDCADCHPDVFNIQKKGTQNFLMKYILERKFCGACHLNVAFPINDCTRCHPTLK